MITDASELDAGLDSRLQAIEGQPLDSRLQAIEGQPLDSRLQAIEGQPLETRAEAYVHLHDELRVRLEGGDAPRNND